MSSRRIPASDFSNPPAWQPRPHTDHRGIWIGKDAFSVPKYYTAVEDVAKQDSDEEFDFTGVDLTQISPVGGKGKERERTPETDGHGRNVKRHKAAHDFSFLEADLPHATAASSASAFAVPSSDLLKCIHHFACNYYSDRGQLFNASRTYRKARKQRRLAKLARKAKLQDEENSDEEEDPVEEADSGQQKSRQTEERKRDMYKTMDGSALLAIGMLLQEHVGRILAPRIPDGWEQRGSEEEEGDEGDGEGDDPDEEDDREDDQDEEEEDPDGDQDEEEDEGEDTDTGSEDESNGEGQEKASSTVKETLRDQRSESDSDLDEYIDD
ncbi:hypothetical protein C8R44DRAFT_215063 [Mycena epipterygia]|nr:hypothetical protein C8R44DRAFT_215063 [Mycena epipterygia]